MSFGYFYDLSVSNIVYDILVIINIQILLIQLYAQPQLVYLFGYLLSTNFHAKTMEHSHEVDNPKNLTQTNAVTQKSSTQESNITMENTIGFQVSRTNADNLKKGSLDTKSDHVQSCSQHVQTMIATIIGISSLCILLFLRDFVSGCVGFLLGARISNNTNSQNPL